MNRHIPQPRTETSTSACAHEAKLLAVMLRTSRLTWVFGEPGTDKSELLKTGVLPLLQRRCVDRGVAPAVAGMQGATQDRRRPSAAGQGQPHIEAAIYFNSWDDAPLTALKHRIAEIMPSAPQQGSPVGARLADLLQRLNQECGVHVIFLLDRFESYLAKAREAGEVVQFANELVEVVLHEDLPATFLVAMDEVARSRLERFRQRMPGFDQNFLRMSALPEPQGNAARFASAAAPEGTAAAVDRLRGRPVSAAPIKVEDIYAFIATTLEKTTTQSPIAPEEGAAHAPAEPAPAPPSKRAVSGTSLATESALTQLDDDTDEDSFFSFPRDMQRQPDRSKKLPEHGLAAALAWLKKR